MYMFLRYPDLFPGLLSASGYTKIQAYVPYTQWVGEKWVDPALAGMLGAAVGAFGNDVMAGNAKGLPVMLIHGREDDNVSGTVSNL